MPNVWKPVDRDFRNSDNVMNLRSGQVARLVWIEGNIACVSPFHTLARDKRKWKLSNVVPVDEVWSSEEPILLDNYYANAHRAVVASKIEERKQEDEFAIFWVSVISVLTVVVVIALAVQ